MARRTSSIVDLSDIPDQIDLSDIPDQPKIDLTDIPDEKPGVFESLKRAIPYTGDILKTVIPEGLKGVGETLNAPTIPFSRLAPDRAGEFSKAHPTIAGGLEAVAGTAEALTSPFNIGLMASGVGSSGAFGRAAAGTFAAQIFIDQLKKSPETLEAYREGDERTKAAIITSLGLDSGMVFAGMKQLISPAPKIPSIRQRPQTPEEAAIYSDTALNKPAIPAGRQLSMSGTISGEAPLPPTPIPPSRRLEVPPVIDVATRNLLEKLTGKTYSQIVKNFYAMQIKEKNEGLLNRFGQEKKNIQTALTQGTIPSERRIEFSKTIMNEAPELIPTSRRLDAPITIDLETKNLLEKITGKSIKEISRDFHRRQAKEKLQKLKIDLSDIPDALPLKETTRELQDIRREVASGFPEYFRGRGLTKAEVLNIIDKKAAGKELTLKQSGILENLMNDRRKIVEDPNQPSTKQWPSQAGASTIPTDIAQAIIDYADGSSSFPEFVKKVFDSPKLLNDVRKYAEGKGIRTVLEGYYEAGKQAAQATKEKGVPQNGFINAEGKAKVRVPGVATLEIDVNRTMGKLETLLGQVENVAKTGTIQPKEIRPGLAYGLPEEKNVTNVKIAESIKSFYVTAAREVKRLRQTAQSVADDFTVSQLKNAEERYSIALSAFMEQRSIAGRTLNVYQQAVKEAKDIGIYLKEVKDIKPAIANLDRTMLAAIRVVSPEKAQRIANGESFFGVLKMSPAPGPLPENLPVARAVLNYFRTNLFAMSSFLKDSIDNAMAISMKLPGYALQDLYASGKGNTPGRIMGIFRSMKEEAASLARGEIYRLPPDIELALGSEIRDAAGQKISRGTNVKAGPFSLDYIVSPAVKLKRAADIIPSRTMTLADLVTSGVAEADKKGLKGLARQKFIDEFIKNPPDEAKQSAIELGRKVKFNVDLPDWQQEISSNWAVQLFGETFPGWGFQFVRWAGRTLGADPALWKKVSAKIKSGEDANPEIIQYLSEAAVGWGGIYLVGQTMYKNVDFNSMEYVDPNDKKRTRLSGLSIIPMALFGSAILHGDRYRAAQSLKYISIPFAGMIAGKPNGLLANWIEATSSYVQGGITNDRFTSEVNYIVNRLVPGRALLSMIKTIHDPVLREGVGAEIPFYSKRVRAVINPVTGEPLQPRQNMMGLEMPSIGGTSIPGASRVQTPLERELQYHEIGLFRDRRTPIAEFATDEIPKELRDEFKVIAGKYLEKAGSNIIESPGYKKLSGTKDGYDLKRDVLQKVFNNAQAYATAVIESQRGVKIKLKTTPVKILAAPEAAVGKRQRFEKVGSR